MGHSALFLLTEPAPGGRPLDPIHVWSVVSLGRERPRGLGRGRRENRLGRGLVAHHGDSDGAEDLAHLFLAALMTAHVPDWKRYDIGK